MHDHVDILLGAKLVIITRVHIFHLMPWVPALQRRATRSLAAQHTGSPVNGAPAQRRVGSPVFRYRGNAACSYVDTLDYLSCVSLMTVMTATHALHRSRS